MISKWNKYLNDLLFYFNSYLFHWILKWVKHFSFTTPGQKNRSTVETSTCTCKSIDHWKAGLQLFHAGQNIDTILHTIGVVKWQTIILTAHFLLENLFIYLSKSIHRTRINLPFASLKLCCLDGPLAYNKPQFKGDFFFWT